MPTVYRRRSSRVQRPDTADTRVVSWVTDGSAFTDYVKYEEPVSPSRRFRELNFEEAIGSLEGHGFTRMLSRDLCEGDDELLMFWHPDKGICVVLSSEGTYLSLAEMFYEWVPSSRDNMPACVSYAYGDWRVSHTGPSAPRWKGTLSLRDFSLDTVLSELDETGEFMRDWNTPPSFRILGSAMVDEYYQYARERLDDGEVRMGRHQYIDRLVSVWLTSLPEAVQEAMRIGQDDAEMDDIF